MHMDMKVIGVTDVKSEAIFDLHACLEAVVASEAAKFQSHLLPLSTQVYRAIAL